MAARKRNLWREYHFNNRDDYRNLQAGWQSSYKAMGKGKRMVFSPGGEIGIVLTNISLRNMALLARHCDVRLPDHVTGWNPDEVAPWEDDESRTSGEAQS